MSDSELKPDCFVVYVTAESEAQAAAIARDVIEARLAACANILLGMRSVYWWNGAVQDGSEAVLVLKTVESRLDVLMARVRELHSYECPCIVAWPIAAGSPDYLRWIAAEASDA